jgi:hypothetical protein
MCSAERAIAHGLGHRVGYTVLADQYDMIFDFFSAPTDYDVLRDDGRLETFTSLTHFFNLLDPQEQRDYREAQVRAVAGRLVDEINFGRQEGVLLLSGGVGA